MEITINPGRWYGLLFLTTILLACQKGTEHQLTYDIRNSQLDTIPALEIQINFRADSDGATHLLYENMAWGQEDLFDGLRELHLVHGAGTIEVQRDSGWIRIDHARDAGPMTLSYKLVQDKPLSEGSKGTYRPIIQSSYFHVFGHNLLMIPQHYKPTEDASARVRINWLGWEGQEVIHNSFGSGLLRQDLGELPLSRLHNAIFVGGDFRVYSVLVEGNELSLAIRGHWKVIKDLEVMELLEKTIKAQRNLWRDHSQKYFTVTMRPFEQKTGSSFQGTGLTNSFAISASNNKYTQTEDLVYIFNHELMHNWIGQAIENESEEAQYWFSEGFTEYFAIKNIANNGIAGHGCEYYIDYLNKTIRDLEASPVKDAPNSDITYQNFWSNQDYEKLPYYRGFLFAFYLDQQIILSSHGGQSLDDVLRDLLSSARQHGKKLSHDHFLSTLKKYLPEMTDHFFEEHIESGSVLPLESLFTELELKYAKEAGIFDLGFEFNGQKDRIEKVEPDSEAFKAGLRTGDTVISYSIHWGMPDKRVELTLERDGKAVELYYLPVRKEAIPQLENSDETCNKINV